jgi:hypothetical protein
MPEKRFKRTPEDFACEWCGTTVKGTGYTDHCPSCLSSKHVDINPGDRASDCQGKMVPVSAVYKGGEFTITYLCKSCLEEKRVKAAEDDNRDLLIQLSTVPAKGKK